jgi:AraC-like DNA-binding protein/GNAT superfamily N-acetyltransferase
MEHHSIEATAAAISYIEAHLRDKLALETVANAVCYSKYHLHRMFTDTLGLTPRAYIQRRQLTEAAKCLVFSQTPVLELALCAGYESQQAFTTVFKAMYKQTPAAYRQNKVFYPLQLAPALKPDPSVLDSACAISYAGLSDLPAWMEFAALVVDGFPCLDRAAHLAQVEGYIRRRQALLVRDGETIVGAAAGSPQAGSIDFLAVHPQYRRCGLAAALLTFMRQAFFGARAVSITTFRAGDKADPGQRAAYQRLGFVESELLVEFGYPTQRLILPPVQGGVRCG